MFANKGNHFLVKTPMNLYGKIKLVLITNFSLFLIWYCQKKGLHLHI